MHVIRYVLNSGWASSWPIMLPIRLRKHKYLKRSKIFLTLNSKANLSLKIKWENDIFKNIPITKSINDLCMSCVFGNIPETFLQINTSQFMSGMKGFIRLKKNQLANFRINFIVFQLISTLSPLKSASRTHRRVRYPTNPMEISICSF